MTTANAMLCRISWIVLPSGEDKPKASNKNSKKPQYKHTAASGSIIKIIKSTLRIYIDAYWKPKADEHGY